MQPADDVEKALLTNDIHVQATYRLTEALVSSEKTMRRRIELLSEVVFEIGASGALSFLNRAWTEALGYPLESSLNLPLREFAVEEDRPLLDRALANASVRSAAGRVPVRLRRRDGGIVWMELSAAALEEGGVVGTLHDVTQERLAQAELAKLSLVASYTDSLVIITDGQGYIEWVNQAFIRKTGYGSEEAFGRKPGAFLQGPDTDPATVKFIGDQLREGRSFQCEILNYTKSGEKYWVAIHVSPIRNGLGEVERFVSIQTDITELRRTQQDLKAAKEAAESASEAKTRFLATISHEMRTPLNVILGTTELAMESGSIAECGGHLRRVNENAETLLRLISDLLDVSKIEAGQFEWERLPFELRTCLQQTLSPVAVQAAHKGLAFEMRLDPLLPERVLGDPARLGQILVNLAENAVKFTESGFVRVEAAAVQPGPGRDAVGLKIRVTDSGAGIPEADLPRVFDRFFQGDSSTTRRKGGAGLGLSIVKSLVDALGGAVTVRNLPGQGAEFDVLLPLEPVSEAEKRPAVPHTDSFCILVAEDNDDNYAITQRHLSGRGYRVERAVNGCVAVEFAARKRYDLILMDLEMPEMDGFQATRLIRLNEDREGVRRVPILALTAHAVKGYRERCLESGCTGYLAKPVRKPALLDAVAAALTESGAQVAEPPTDRDLLYVEVDPDLADLVPGFLDNCRKDTALVQQALAAGDWVLATRIGHSMKGSAPSYGFDEISHLGKEIEIAG
jgi:PAS domain S-box-containing protein